MITIKKQEIVKLEDVLHLYHGCRLDKLYPSTRDVGAGLISFISDLCALDGDAVVGL